MCLDSYLEWQEDNKTHPSAGYGYCKTAHSSWHHLVRLSNRSGPPSNRGHGVGMETSSPGKDA